MLSLDPRLAADTHFVADAPLCQIRLMDDQRFFWLILVPRREGVSEVFDLCATDQDTLWREVGAVASALRKATHAAKINIGALGNLVSQLHVHVVARRADDAAWPGPVWGAGAAQRLAPDALTARLAMARSLCPTLEGC